MSGKKRGAGQSFDADFETMAGFDTLSNEPVRSATLDGRHAGGRSDSAEPSSKRKGPSLKVRAIAMLSRREHSRQELKRKLAPHAEESDDVDALLDELARGNWQSDARFAQSLVNRRAGRQGTQAIVRELGRHGLAGDAVAQLSGALTDTELERARAVWEKKFGVLPADARDYARQYRFLASRGFSSDSVRRILGDRD